MSKISYIQETADRCAFRYRQLDTFLHQGEGARLGGLFEGDLAAGDDLPPLVDKGGMPILFELAIYWGRGAPAARRTSARSSTGPARTAIAT